MSQRKEKYLRRSMEQYNGIAEDVDYIKNEVEILGRRLENMEWDRQMIRQEWSSAARENREIRNRIERKKDSGGAVQMALEVIGLGVMTILAVAAIITAAQGISGENAEAQAAEVTETAQLLELPAAAEETAEIVDLYREEIPLSREEQQALFKASEEFGVRYPLAVAVVDVETGFRNVAGDGGRSVGYMQVNEGYHAAMMEEIGAESLWAPADNFRTGIAYLSEQIEAAESEELGLMAYNMGPSGAAVAWEEGIYETEYSQKVLERAEYWAAIMGR